MSALGTPCSQQQAVRVVEYEGAKNTVCVDTKSNAAKQIIRSAYYVIDTAAFLNCSKGPQIVNFVIVG